MLAGNVIPFTNEVCKIKETVKGNMQAKKPS